MSAVQYIFTLIKYFPWTRPTLSSHFDFFLDSDMNFWIPISSENGYFQNCPIQMSIITDLFEISWHFLKTILKLWFELFKMICFQNKTVYLFHFRSRGLTNVKLNVTTMLELDLYNLAYIFILIWIFANHNRFYIISVYSRISWPCPNSPFGLV